MESWKNFGNTITKENGNMRKVVVPEDLMNMITAMCDVLIADGRDDVATRTAREVRKEIDKGLEYGVETSIF